MFEENELSDTVVEFRASSKRSSFSKLSAVAGVLFAIFLLCSLMIQVRVAHVAALVVALSLFIILKYTVKEESVTVIKNFGIQLRLKYLFGNEKVEFFDNDRINSVFIHEYFYGSQVRYSLAFIIKGQDKMTLVFKHVYPGFDKLKRVYQACRQNC